MYRKKCLTYYAHSSKMIVGPGEGPREGRPPERAGDRRLEMIGTRLEAGDVSVCGGVRAEIGEIFYQDYNDESWGKQAGWMCEFRDTNGRYRYWKQMFDGGFVIAKAKKGA